MHFDILTISSSSSTPCLSCTAITSTWLMNGTRRRWVILSYHELLSFTALIETSPSLSLQLRCQTWMYLTVPVLLYGSERFIRALRSSIKAVTIQKVTIFSHFNTNLLFRNDFTSCANFLWLFWRWQFILEMSWHFTCQSLKDLDTRVGNTCLSTVRLCLHLNGWWIHSIFYPFVRTSKNFAVIVLLMGNHMFTGTHFLSLRPQEMTTSVFTSELSVIGQGSFEQCSQRFVFWQVHLSFF